MTEKEVMKFVIERSNDPIIKNPVLREAMNKDLGPRPNYFAGGFLKAGKKLLNKTPEPKPTKKIWGLPLTEKSKPSILRREAVPLNLTQVNEISKNKEFEQAWKNYKISIKDVGRRKYDKNQFFEIWARENMAHGGRTGFVDKGFVDKGAQIANTKDAKFKSIMGNPKLVEVAEAYFPEKNSKNVNWDKVLNIRERSSINTGRYTLEKAEKFITNEDISSIKKALTKEEFAKLDFDSVVHGISNRRRAGWLGVSSQEYGDTTKLRQKVARILDGRGLKNPEREAGIKKRTADLLKRNNLINEMITENKPLNIMEMTRKIGLNDRGEYIKNYVTDTFGQKKLFKIFPNQRIILEKNVNRLANSKPVLKFLENGTLLDKKNIQYIAKNFFNNDADLAGRTLFHMAEAAKGEKAYMKNLKLDNLKPFKKQINEIITAAENDIFGNPAGNMSRARKERVLADQIGEGSQFFRDSRTNLNKVSKEVFDEFGVKGIGTAVDELATITVPYKFGSPGYSVYQQQLTKTGDKVMDDMNMVKAKRLDRSLVDIRKALSNGTATQDMVDIYNEKVSAIASEINKDVPKNGKRLQPFLIELGGDPRKTVSNFKNLVKQNPLAAQNMLETAKTQGWSGVIPADVPTIYDLRNTDNVKKEMTNSLQSIFKQKNVNKLKQKIQQTPIKKIQQLFKKFGPRFVEAPIEDNRMLVAKGGQIERTGFAKGTNFEQATKRALQIAKLPIKAAQFVGGGLEPFLEYAFARPYMQTGDIDGAFDATTAGLFGAGNFDIQSIKETNPNAYRYGRSIEINKEYQNLLNIQVGLEKFIQKAEDEGTLDKVDANMLKLFNENEEKMSNLSKEYYADIEFTNKDGDTYLNAKADFQQFMRKKQIDDYENKIEKAASVSAFDNADRADVIENIKSYDTKNDPRNFNKITDLKSFIEAKGEPMMGNENFNPFTLKPGLADKVSRYGVEGIFDNFVLGMDKAPNAEAGYGENYEGGKDIEDLYSELPVEYASQLASLEKEDLEKGLAAIERKKEEELMYQVQGAAHGGIMGIKRK
jgi:hypothetical protein